MVEVPVKKEKSHFILSLENGTIVTFAGLDTPVISSHQNHHISTITSMVLSPCGGYLITCGADALIFVYEVRIFNPNNEMKQQDFSFSTVVDDFLADVVLVNKK